MSEPWVSPWWQTACLPDTWNVCGIRTRSLSLWHITALEKVGNAYLCGTPATIDDAASLLIFAAQDYRRGKWLLLSRAWLGLKIKWIHRKLKRTPFEKLDIACREYVETCTRSARRWSKQLSGKSASVPYQWHLVMLMMKLGSSYEQAWNTPYAVARCLFDAESERRGDDSLMSEQAHALDDKMAEGI